MAQRSIIKLSDSSKVKINMDGAFISGNMSNTNVLSIERSKDVTVSARNLQVHDTSRGGGGTYPQPRMPVYREKWSSSSSSDSSDDDWGYSSSQYMQGHRRRQPSMIIVTMEVGNGRSLTTRFDVTKTLEHIKQYIRDRSEPHRNNEFYLVEKQLKKKLENENETLQSLQLRDNCRLSAFIVGEEGK